MKIKSIIIFILISLIVIVSFSSIYFYTSIKEKREDISIIGEFQGCGLYQIHFLNNDTTIDNGYILHMYNVTFFIKNVNYISPQTEFWFSSIGHYTIETLNRYIDEKVRISYHTNLKDETIIDLIEVWE